eukprot:364203-Chlamydomonas_euryale.AAC.3
MHGAENTHWVLKHAWGGKTSALMVYKCSKGSGMESGWPGAFRRMASHLDGWGVGGLQLLRKVASHLGGWKMGGLKLLRQVASHLGGWKMGGLKPLRQVASHPGGHTSA